MSESQVSGIQEEVVQLNTIPGTGGTQHNGDTVISISERCAPSCCEDSHYRKLAISSIICGLSCIGIYALINSIKAENTEGQKRKNASRKARKLAIISIVVWLAILASIPILMALISYIITLQN
ncbi:hypothetical protein PBY51_007673 [Eleginops maclovinus]|uniref:Transmembrane protein 265 n=1 Tax=Eleginops maclovinus TaxID=56733 RepID=A0AAN7X6W3_ELEMC|nr:hypothetical protein PBY51_007673 [Eleginops maclovinus]